jgi:hypothetical protein
MQMLLPNGQQLAAPTPCDLIKKIGPAAVDVMFKSLMNCAYVFVSIKSIQETRL